MWLLQAKDRVGAKARGGNRPGPEQGMRGQESGLGAGLAGAGCSCNGARPDPHTLLSARINNYLNFFHLSRDRNTGKHGKGKGIDPSQLLPTPPHCSHRSPHRAIWPSLPRASLLNRSSRSHTQTSTGPPRQPATQGGCGPHNITIFIKDSSQPCCVNSCGPTPHPGSCSLSHDLFFSSPPIQTCRLTWTLSISLNCVISESWI